MFFLVWGEGDYGTQIHAADPYVLLAGLSSGLKIKGPIGLHLVLPSLSLRPRVEENE